MTEPSLIATLASVVAAAAIDLRTGLIPDLLTRCGASAVFVIASATNTLPAAACGAGAVAGGLLAIFIVTRGRGIGFGDVKLGVVIGAGCGAGAGLLALGAAFVLGAVYAVGLLLTRRASRRDAVAFAPFLAAGTIVAATASWMGA